MNKKGTDKVTAEEAKRIIRKYSSPRQKEELERMSEIELEELAQLLQELLDQTNDE